jgi:hypothetical protein
MIVIVVFICQILNNLRPSKTSKKTRQNLKVLDLKLNNSTPANLLKWIGLCKTSLDLKVIDLKLNNFRWMYGSSDKIEKSIEAIKKYKINIWVNIKCLSSFKLFFICVLGDSKFGEVENKPQRS